jgi:integrase
MYRFFWESCKMSKSKKVPSYRLHKARNCAVVTIDGQAVYLGPFGSPESHARYAVEIAKWERNRANGPTTSAVAIYTVGRLAADYLKFAKQYYVKKGEPTSQVHQVKQAMTALVALHEIEPAVAFGPVKLKNVQQQLTIPRRSRGYINTLVGVIKQAFRWAASEELIPATTYDALRTVSGLKKGRCAARETTPIGPVDDYTVNETIKHVSPIVADMIRLQLLTGMRPQEVCLLRPCDVTFGTDETACYRPESHKTEHHGRERRIYLGPQAVAILRPYLVRAPQAACFSPADSNAWHRAKIRSKRKTPLYPSHLARYAGKRKVSPRRGAGDQYSTNSYRQAIERGCEAAFGMPDHLRKIDASLALDQRQELRRAARAWRQENCWAPNRLRHAQASRIRAKFGLEAAQVCLGHTDPQVTVRYAEWDFALAAKVMREIG